MLHLQDAYKRRRHVQHQSLIFALVSTHGILTEQNVKTWHHYVLKARDVWAGSKLSMEVEHHSSIFDSIRLRAIFVCRVFMICPQLWDQPYFVEDGQARVEEDGALLGNRSARQYEEYYQFTRRCLSTKSGTFDCESFCELMGQGVRFWREEPNKVKGEARLVTADGRLDDMTSKTLLLGQSFYDFLEQAVPIPEIDCTRVLASTSIGSFGCIPNRSQPGDIICLFQGASYPFVIRERDDG